MEFWFVKHRGPSLLKKKLLQQSRFQLKCSLSSAWNLLLHGELKNMKSSWISPTRAPHKSSHAFVQRARAHRQHDHHRSIGSATTTSLANTSPGLARISLAFTSRPVFCACFLINASDCAWLHIYSIAYQCVWLSVSVSSTQQIYA